MDRRKKRSAELPPPQERPPLSHAEELPRLLNQMVEDSFSYTVLQRLQESHTLLANVPEARLFVQDGGSEPPVPPR